MNLQRSAQKLSSAALEENFCFLPTPSLSHCCNIMKNDSHERRIKYKDNEINCQGPIT